jgi:hypothetical protein
MKTEVAAGIAELKKQFPESLITVRDDGGGGAYVVIEAVDLGDRFKPNQAWIGFHIPPQYPYADIYPVFIDGGVTRKDGVAFAAPVTAGHHFEGRPAIQISRRNNAAQSNPQKAPAKVLKVLDFLQRLAS